MFRTATLWVVIGILLSVGCAIPQKKAKVLDVPTGNPSVVTYPAELRGAYIIDKKTLGRKICAEPAPDVALDTLQKMTASLTKGATKAEMGAELSAKVVELAGRSSLVLLAREMLYRACELSINAPNSSTEVNALYAKAFEVITTLGAIDLAKVTIKKAEAERLLLEAETENLKLQSTP